MVLNVWCVIAMLLALVTNIIGCYYVLLLVVAGAWLYHSAVVAARALAQRVTTVCSMHGAAPLGSVRKYSLIEITSPHKETRVDDVTIHSVMRVTR
jgi:hypothetical protein